MGGAGGRRQVVCVTEPQQARLPRLLRVMLPGLAACAVLPALKQSSFSSELDLHQGVVSEESR